MREFLLAWGLLLTVSASAQDKSFVKATYKLGSAKEYLQRDTDYPRLARVKNITGDVVYRITIDEHGITDTIRRVNPGHPMLADQVAEAFAKLNGTWNPTRIEGKAVTYAYIIVFRFRLDVGEGFPHYERRCQRFIAKRKWKKALETSDDWLVDDAYNVSLWRYRSEILEALGLPGSTKAKSKADHLAREVLLNIPIIAEGNELINSNGAVERFD